MKIILKTLAILAVAVLLYQLGINSRKQEKGLCDLYFVVLDSQDKKEIHPYVFQVIDDSHNPWTMDMDGAKGVFFMPSSTPVKVLISAKGYSTNEVVVDPSPGGFSTNPPREVLLQHLP